MYNSDFLNSVSKDLTIFMAGEKSSSYDKSDTKEYCIINKFDKNKYRSRNIFICVAITNLSAFNKCNILLQDKIDNSKIFVIKDNIPNTINIKYGNYYNLFEIIDSTCEDFSTNTFFISDEFIQKYFDTYCILKHAYISYEYGNTNNNGFKQNFKINTIEWYKPWEYSIRNGLEYDMKLAFKLSPINIIGPIAYTSSTDKKIFKSVIIGKYWENDTNANSYKVSLYLNDYKMDSFYSMDLIHTIKEGYFIIIDDEFEYLKNIFDMLKQHKIINTSNYLQEFNNKYDLNNSNKDLINVFIVIEFLKSLF